MAIAPAVGLNYLAVEAVLRMQRVPRPEWPTLLDDIRVMEGAALQVMWQE